MVLKIAESLTEYEFTLITSNIDYKKIKSENIELIKGHWNKQLISDEELRKIYSDASLSIIPIKTPISHLDKVLPYSQCQWEFRNDNLYRWILG